MFHTSLCRSLLLATLVGTALLAVFGTAPAPALASTGGGGDMPWDPLLDSLVANLGGRTLRNILIVAIIGAGIGFYFANEGTWIRSAFGLVIGFSIAAAAATWGPAFFGVAAAATGHPSPLRPIAWTDWLSLTGCVLTWMALVVVVGWRVGALADRWSGCTPPTMPERCQVTAEKKLRD